MDARKLYQGGKFINAKTMKGKDPVTLTITGVTEVLDQKQKPALALMFRETEARFQLNKGNYSKIEAALGYETDQWLNRTVTLAFDPSVQMSGTTTGGVRVTKVQ